MEDTVLDKIVRVEQNYEKLNKQVQENDKILHRLNREHITPVSEASANAREVLG